MKIAVIGATGETGRLVVDQAIQRGHEVIAYVRRPEALEKKQGLSIVAGQLDNQAAFQSAIKGVDAVLCCLGTCSLFNVEIMQQNLPLVTAAMQGAGVKRLVLLSAYGVGETAKSASLPAWVAYKTLMASVYKDKEKSEAVLRQTPLKVTGIYPVILTNDPLTEATEAPNLLTVEKVVGFPKVSRANVAKVMLDAAEDNQTIGQSILVTTRTSYKSKSL